jgi:uncharacterized SAM-binding protein YcdF (DUF218 family)
VPRPLTWRRRLADLAIVAIAFALGAALLTGYTAYRVWDVGQHDNRRHVDAIVVLGAAQYNGRPSAVLAARLDHAIELYKAGYAPYLVVTGGNLPGDLTTEAETGRRYAANRGVPADAILMEKTGGTTLESIRNVRAIFEAHDLHTALFVSDRTHMLRVLRQAADQGIEAWGSPTDTSPADTDPDMHFDAFMHELGGLAEYEFLQQQSQPDLPTGAVPAATATSSAVPLERSVASSTAPSPAPGR